MIKNTSISEMSLAAREATELLAPARDVTCGIEAINHGADAVYIGAPAYGARAAAGNSIEDIKRMVDYAHLYNARVYVTVNTILADEELSSVEKTIWQLYETGVDALIIQDLGLLKLNLPPIRLHASTQMDNRTPEKVDFLSKCGFHRVILARELSLQEIKDISFKTDIELEVFVHGALCVSYSGRCYMSEFSCGRSANRGNCAQYCRLSYSLEDTNGEELFRNKHFLSLKDMDRSDYLEQLIDAGIRSFKIEGRLKGVEYVKNVTAYYRKKLDEIIARRDDLRKASSGDISFDFEPNPEKTFHRGKTEYFINGERTHIAQFDTPKSTGEYIGSVAQVGSNYIRLFTDKPIANGDGMCFADTNGYLTGFKVNRFENGRIYPSEMPEISNKAKVYRNFDHEFNKLLGKKSAERRINTDIEFIETESGFRLVLTDEDGISVVSDIKEPKVEANKPEQAESSIRTQLNKLGGTPYIARETVIRLSKPMFFPTSKLAEWRREAVVMLTEKRLTTFMSCSEAGKSIAKDDSSITCSIPDTAEGKADYTHNIMNEKAKEFYLAHGVSDIEYAVEKTHNVPEVLMRCKHCIKYELGWCSKTCGMPEGIKEPLYLVHGADRYRLSFDCKRCEMSVISCEEMQ